MFQHLDDPAPFTPDRRFHSAVLHRGRQLRRRRRLAASFGGTALTVSLLVGGVALYVDRRDAAIDRTDVITADSVDGAVNILVVGSDVRTGAFADPDIAGARSDTIVVLRLNPDGSVAVLPIPRDLQVPATGQRINAYAGDPQALVDTVTGFLGIPVDHYAEVDFAGFVEMVDEVGGLEVSVAVPLVDHDTGLLLAPSPCTTIDGETALALVRARHVEGENSGDLGRIVRGQGILAAAVAQLAAEADDPLAIDRFSRILADHAVLDDGLTLGRLVDIGRQLAAAGPGGVHMATLPLVDGLDTVSLYLAPEAGAVLQQCGAPADVSVPTPPGPSVSVQMPAEVATQIGPC